LPTIFIKVFYYKGFFMGGNMKDSTLRTFIYKIGDVEADSKIKSILGEGWRLSAVTPNGTVRIATFDRDFISAQRKILSAN